MITDQDHQLQPTDEYRITRRMALATLATLSSSLLAKVQMGPLTPLLIEEFLAQCATSITTCWHLLNSDGISTVEYTLPKYLPHLVSIAQQPSPYQKTAAYLGSQGSILMCLISYHRLHFQRDLAYAQQAVTLANISVNRNLQVYALLHLGGAFGLNGQPEFMLQKQREASQYLDEVVLPLRSKVLAELALSYAQQRQVKEALRSINEARNLPTNIFEEIPNFIVADSGHFQLIIFEGLTHLALSESDRDHIQEHSGRASEVLAQFSRQISEIKVPERSKIEIINHQAKAAIGTRDLDEFEYYLLAGASGAKALGSEKRRQEATSNWKEARELWPHEKRIVNLADVLF